jgi:MFS family permease
VIAAILSISYSLIVFAIFAIIAAMIIGIGLHDSIINTSGTATGEKRVSAREALTASVLLLGIITFVKTFASYGIVSWIPVYVSNIKGLGLTVSLGYVLTSMFIAAIIGQPIFGILADRYDKRYVMALSSIGTAVSISLYLVTSGALGIVFLIIFGFFTFSAFPLLFALISEYVSRGGSSMANAFVWGFGNQAGMALGPFFVGILIFNTYSHLAFMFYIMAILVVVSAALLMLLPKPKKKVQMPLF